MRRVVLSPRAETDVAEMYAYISDQSGEARADIVVNRLLVACQKLDMFPEQGIRRDDLHPGLRVMGYRRQATIAFVVEADRVIIHGILGKGRDLERVFDDSE